MRNRLECQQGHFHAVLFVTADGGRTWKPDRMSYSTAKGMPPACHECTVLAAVTGSAWIVANYARNTSAIPPSLTTLDTGAKVDFSDDGNGPFWPPMNGSDLLRLDFATPSVGWVGWNGQLLSTTNGGGTWTPITPKLNQTVAAP